MKSPSTRRAGRLRSLLVLAAMAVSVVAGTSAAALADDAPSAVTGAAVTMGYSWF